MRHFYGWKFAATIALPLLLASLGVALLTFDLLSRVSTGANREDRERTRQVVISALDSVQMQLANIVSDNSYWDDAVRHAYGKIDAQWVNETWGAPSEMGTNYDLSLLVDRTLPRAMAGYRMGQPFTPLTRDQFSDKLDGLLDQLPTDGRTHDAKAMIAATPDGLAIIAAAPVLPASEGVSIPGGRLRFLVFAKFLTPDYVAAIGKQYVIKDLKLLPVSDGGHGLEIIKDISGKPVAAVQWTDRRPGDIASAAVSQKAAAVLGFLALVMICVALLCWRLIRAIAAREATAVNDALHDPLTGLPNRAALNADADRLLRQGRETVAAAFIDLDGFKEVNDNYDHETGDRLIRAVASGLSVLVRQASVYRLGGDEFVALFKGTNALESAQELSAGLIALLAKPFDFEGRMASVGASIGIAVASPNSMEATELMRRADVAMYRAKDGGRNRCCVFQDEFDAERLEQQGIASELRQIIADRAIEVVYQPVVNARSRNIVSVEALARWPSDSARKITPDRFISVAENAGLIDDLGDLVLAKACADAMQWPGLRLAVNISPVQLCNPDFVTNTLATIAAAGMDCHRVELEITEGVLVDDISRAKRIFDELRSAGIQIALDDFGTGFSSIGYLRQFDFDRIKIDRSIVSRILAGSSEQSIVQGTMLMAAGLTAEVTAEGVEDEDQINLLRLSGCSEMQGYYFFRPQPASSIGRLLEPDGCELRLAIA